ncbi:MAG TPA: hypothetical protein VMU16_03215 [Candidatus Binataceae bacterium]|nr:hypothetical protein [Candidatus Binataceae bacterium]
MAAEFALKVAFVWTKTACCTGLRICSAPLARTLIALAPVAIVLQMRLV